MSSLPLSLIVAATRNYVIGQDNQMPWDLPEDLRYFKQRTLGKPIIMGRKTWDSIGRPLPGRLNIVITRQTDLELEGAEVFTDLSEAIVCAENWAVDHDAPEIMIIGGGQLYRQALPRADKVYLTRIEATLAGDTHFPELPFDEWQRTDAQPFPAQGDTPAYTFEVWQRRSPAGAKAET